MARRRRERQKVIRGRGPSSARSKTKSVNVSIPLSRLPRRSSEARTKALHVKAAMLRDPNLRLYPTARSFGVKPHVVKKYLGSGFTKIDGHFRAIKSGYTLRVATSGHKSVPICGMSVDSSEGITQPWRVGMERPSRGSLWSQLPVL